MDVFLDLHNPAPGDPTFFYILPSDLLREPMIGLRDRLIDLAYSRISKVKPLIPMSNKPKLTCHRAPKCSHYGRNEKQPF
jgi:hypothetical protein